MTFPFFGRRRWLQRSPAVLFCALVLLACAGAAERPRMDFLSHSVGGEAR